MITFEKRSGSKNVADLRLVIGQSCAATFEVGVLFIRRVFSERPLFY